MTKFIHSFEKNYQVYIVAAFGLLLILIPNIIVRVVPYVLGGGLIAYAGYNAYRVWKSGDREAHIGKYLVYLIVGIMALIQRDNARVMLGVIWAMLSLQECAEEIDEYYHTRELHLFKMIWVVISIVLAFLLLHDPFEHFVFHMRILGLEVIATAFMRWKSLNPAK